MGQIAPYVWLQTTGMMHRTIWMEIDWSNWLVHHRFYCPSVVLVQISRISGFPGIFFMLFLFVFVWTRQPYQYHFGNFPVDANGENNSTRRPDKISLIRIKESFLFPSSHITLPPYLVWAISTVHCGRKLRTWPIYLSKLTLNHWRSSHNFTIVTALPAYRWNNRSEHSRLFVDT